MQNLKSIQYERQEVVELLYILLDLMLITIKIEADDMVLHIVVVLCHVLVFHHHHHHHYYRFNRTKNDDIVPNNQYHWSIDFKEIPFFLTVFDNRNRAHTNSYSKHDYLLFITDDYGQMSVYNFPNPMAHTKPTRIGTSELFSKNSRLLMESFAVYEFAIVVYVRRFEQRTNEIEHSKLIKAGLPIMKGEQVRFSFQSNC